MCKIMCKWEVVMFLVVLGAHVKLFTPIIGCRSDANFASTSMMLFAFRE